MATAPGSRAWRARVQARRQRLRAQGLRPIQIWLPDTKSPRFACEAHRRSLAVASSEGAGSDQAFIDSAQSESTK